MLKNALLSGELNSTFIDEILDLPHQKIWSLLNQVSGNFILYDGTAISLRLGHRKSIGFDFFTSQTFLPDNLFREIEFLQNSVKIQEKLNTLTVLVSLAEFSNPVKISFFGDLNLGQISPPNLAENDIHIASLKDLFGMKCATISQRAEKKDYLDIHAIIKNTKLDLQDGLAAAQGIYGSQYNPVITLKSLSYFKDGNVSELSSEIQTDLIQAIRDIKIENIPQITCPCIIGDDIDQGHETMNSELIKVAQRINWFDNPEKLLNNPRRFLCYFMQYCQFNDIPIVKKYFSKQQFRKALDTAPPGIIDVRSKAYWEIVLPKIYNRE